VNDIPTFAKGQDQVATDETKLQSIAGWATAIQAGPADESSQTLAFVVTTDNGQLFESPPAIDAAGTLTFTPKPNARGSDQVTVELRDNGGPIQGGGEPSTTQVFTIQIEKPHPWHNAKLPFDVDGNDQVVPLDALLIINYLNSLPPNSPANVPLTAGVGHPFGFLDTNRENTIAPIDALNVINHLNAEQAAAEGESGPAQDAQTGKPNAVSKSGAERDWANLMALLAADVAEQAKRRRAGG
jgi:hypothetical protein